MFLEKGAIQAVRLSKQFTHYRGSWGRLADWFGLKVGAQAKSVHSVLEEISFSIEPGAAVGVVGRNGAGKSTLLKLLTGTLEPNSGTVWVHGRVAALLELGMGFHPELTGRQNAYIAGALQGATQDEMAALMPEIVAYAEIGDAFDQPLRTYSSGMQVRLAFSIATAQRPDILIVDEALSVGDAYFQHKCYRRIRHLLDDGVTLLFVSHDPLSVRSLCNRAVLLERGKLVLDGSPVEVLDYYNAMIAEDDKRADAVERASIRRHEGQTHSGSRQASIVDVLMFSSGRRTESVTVGDPVTFRVSYRVEQKIEDITVGFMIRDRLGNEVFGINSTMMGVDLPVAPLHEEVIVEFDLQALNLGAGDYNVSVALHRATSHLAGNYDWRDQVVTFKVGPHSSCSFAGVAYLPCSVALRSGTS